MSKRDVICSAAVVYRASDRVKIAKKVRVGQKIRVPRMVKDEDTRKTKVVMEVLTVTGKYPAFISCVNNKGTGCSIDYFDYDKIRRGVYGNLDV